MNKLILFAKSDRPDAYINSIVHCVLKENVNSITVIRLARDDSEESLKKSIKSAANISTSITRQLTELAGGKYVNITRKATKATTVDPTYYDRCLTTLSNANGMPKPTAIEPSRLRTEMARLCHRDARTIADITALGNSDIIDVATTLLEIGNCDLHSFEILRKPHYDHSDLYHNLSAQKSYRYHAIGENTPVRNLSRKIRNRVISTGFIVETIRGIPKFVTEANHRQRGRKGLIGNSEGLLSDEYDLQDVIHCILSLHFQVEREAYSPSYACSYSRIDFLIRNEKIAIEAKFLRKRADTKRIVDEAIIDIARYKKHPDCRNLIIFIYDPHRRCQSPQEIESELTAPDKTVLAVVAPQH